MLAGVLGGLEKSASLLGYCESPLESERRVQQSINIALGMLSNFNRRPQVMRSRQGRFFRKFNTH